MCHQLMSHTLLWTSQILAYHVRMLARSHRAHLLSQKHMSLQQIEPLINAALGAVQEDLLRGSSGISVTFGNACLASANEFGVRQVELWSLSRI